MRAQRGDVYGLAVDSDLLVEADHPHSPAGSALRRAYADGLVGIVGAAGSTAPFDVTADADLTAPGGAFWTVTAAGDPMGCAGARTLEPGTVPGAVGVVELKRFFVLPAARGRGIGRALLSRAEEWALARGADVVVLDTASVLVGAGRLYRSAGYEPVAAYNDNPYADVWLARRLAPER